MEGKKTKVPLREGYEPATHGYNPLKKGYTPVSRGAPPGKPPAGGSGVSKPPVSKK